MSPVELVAAPERSLEQRMDALRRANRIRSFRAVMKRELKECRLDPVSLLLDPPDELSTMKVFQLQLARALGR
jgi:hypothetical protein